MEDLPVSFDADWFIKVDGSEASLTVLPAVGEGQNLTSEKLMAALKGLGLGNVDEGAAKRALLEPGTTVPIAVAGALPALDGRVQVALSSDKMVAAVRVIPPLGGTAVNEAVLRQELHNAGVVYGLDDEGIRSAVLEADPLKTYVVARGIPPVRGRDAELKFMVAISSQGRMMPQEREDGTVDFRELNLIENVRAGQVLVEKIPASDGVPGVTVLGEAVPGIAGQDVKILAGKNTQLSEDGLKLFATIAGHVTKDKSGRIEVQPVYQVNAVDFTSGNIDFVGSVLVKGDVAPGFHVKSNGDVEVRGGVDAAFIQADGNVKVDKGIQGAGKGYIKAGKNVAALFVENAVIEAGGSVEVGRSIMHSKVVASEDVIVGGSKGLIVGGLIRAGKRVVARTVGSSLGTVTEIEVGIDPGLRQELNAIASRLKEIERQLEATSIVAAQFKKVDVETLPPGKRELAIKLIRVHEAMETEAEQLRTRLAEINQKLSGKVSGQVRVRDVIYPGVRVTIGQASILISDTLRYVTLYLGEDGQVAVGPY